MSEVYDTIVYGERPILFKDLNVAQDYVDERLENYYEDDSVDSWVFDEEDGDLMLGSVEEGGHPIASIRRKILFSDAQTATKWRAKQRRKNDE